MAERKLQRKAILQTLGDLIDDKALLVAALAGTTNECFHNLHRPGNLYLVGMGMVTPVAFGLAKALPKRNVVALDTDGSLLLSPSILPVVGTYRPANLCAIVFDNEALHATNGGPASQTAYGTDLAAIAGASAIEESTTVQRVETFAAAFGRFLTNGGPAVIVCKIAAGYERGEGPTFNGQENKFRLVRFIEATESIKILGGSK